MRRKRCRCCQQLYLPCPQTYRQQKTCKKPGCRAVRKRRAQKAWSRKNPYYWESCRSKQKLWREKNKGYWGQWRKEHPGYVKGNRRMQKRRDARKRGFLAKQDTWNAICIDKLGRIKAVGDLAKQDEWTQAQGRQIDGILNYLKGQLVLAKQDAIDLGG